jgi:hypothetical protein
MTEAMLYSETSVFIEATRGYIQGDSILHSHRQEDLKSYNMTLHYNISLSDIFLVISSCHRIRAQSRFRLVLRKSAYWQENA